MTTASGRAIRRLAAVMAVNSMLVACGDGQPVADAPVPTHSGAESDAAAAQPEVDPSPGLSESILADAGQSWSLVDGTPLIDGIDIWIAFEPDSVTGFDDCNGFGGSYEQTATLLMIRPTGVTEVACRNDVEAAAERFRESVFGATGFSLIDGQLVLTGGANTLTFDAEPIVAIESIIDVIWLLETVASDGEIVPAAGSSSYLLFSGDGALEGSTGCRALSGSWTSPTPSRVFLPNLAADGSCSPDRSAQDGAVIGVLEGGFRLSIEDEVLTIRSPHGDQLTLRRSANPPPEPAAMDQVGFAFDPDVDWVVAELSPEEFVEVHAEPGGFGGVVAELGSNERLIAAGSETVEVDGERWRQVHTDAMAQGWVPDHYLVRVLR